MEPIEYLRHGLQHRNQNPSTFSIEFITGDIQLLNCCVPIEALGESMDTWLTIHPANVVVGNVQLDHRAIDQGMTFGQIECTIRSDLLVQWQ